jgi:hypothetical protein
MKNTKLHFFKIKPSLLSNYYAILSIAPPTCQIEEQVLGEIHA